MPSGVQGLDHYAYVNNDPVKYTDPQGHEVKLPPYSSGGLWFDYSNAPLLIQGILDFTLPLACSIIIACQGDPSSHTVWGTPTEQIAVIAPALLTAGVLVPEGPVINPSTQKPATGGTYLLKDSETGQVMRTGRTSNLAQRAAQHARNPLLSEYEFEIDLRVDDYAVQRGREQIIHDEYKPPLNKINPISPTNPKYNYYINAAKNHAR